MIVCLHHPSIIAEYHYVIANPLSHCEHSEAIQQFKVLEKQIDCRASLAVTV
jgi:hypothetical protein